MDLEMRGSDLVVIRLTLRGRDGGQAITLDESVSVADLGLGGEGAAVAPAISFDGDEYARLMAEGAGGNPESIEKALQMLATLNEESAEFVASGGTPPAESLAQAVVSWVIETRPQGETFTADAHGDGYVISAKEINIHGPVDFGDGDRMFRVTAVGTWGC